MRATILLQELLGLQQTQVQGFEFTETGLVVDVAPRTRSPYCAGCCRRCRRGYDGRERTWRHVDLGMSCTFRGLTAGGGASPDQGKRAGGAVASTRVLKAHGAMGSVGAATPSTEHIVHARHLSPHGALPVSADAGPRLRIHRDGAGRR